jgi:alginate O-acetyltransferase complex protein AlgI
MVFSSILFLTIFFPLFILGYFILPKKINIKHIYILIASFIFYAWGEPKFVFVLFFTTIIDFFLVKKMDSYDNPFKRKLLLCFPILINLGLLCYFKYLNFFIDNFNMVGGIFNLTPVHFSKIILPIGISFYTFESITYSVDVYKRIHKPLNKFWEYQMYIIFFPKLIAGPIVRYHDIASQIHNHINSENFKIRINGFIRFCIGLSKKVLIANVLGQQADAIFNLNPNHLTTTIAWLGALAYTMQIYFDFSGYSDMAIGISKIMGFILPENFNNPYTSKSVTEFWKRWHITLGNWMKNYIYIPLGGNRVKRNRILFNLFIIFVLSGIWHGAGWNFIFWGIYYGIFLVLERLFLKNPKSNGVRSYLGLIYTFIIVTVGWVFFRIENTQIAFDFICKMFSLNFSNEYVFIYKSDFFFLLIIALLFSFCTLNNKIEKFQDRLFKGLERKREIVVFSILGLVAYIVCLVSLSSGQFNPFIYFNF